MLSALSAMFKRATRPGYVNRNPVQGVPRAREHATALPLVTLADQTRLLMLAWVTTSSPARSMSASSFRGSTRTSVSIRCRD